MTNPRCPTCRRRFKPKDKRRKYCSRRCAGIASGRRRTGRTRTTKGYIALWMPDNEMADRHGYVLEHRVVMAAKLGRALLPTEVVHHLNGLKGDNREENLVVMEKRLHDRQPKKPPQTVACPHCAMPVPVKARQGGVVDVVEPWSNVPASSSIPSAGLEPQG